MKNNKFLAITVLAIIAIVCGIVLAACVTPNEHVCESKCSDPSCGKCTNSICQEEACKEKCPVGGDHSSGQRHECESKCLVCQKCTNATCTEDVCKDKCRKHGDEHECEHACPVDGCGKCLDPDCNEGACAIACQGHGDAHVCKHECSSCQKCTDSTCTEAKCQNNQCQGHGDAHVCKHECPICHKCTDSTCTEAKCKNNQCQGHGEHHVCLHICPVCKAKGNDNMCTSDCGEANCSNKCPGHEYDDYLEYDMSDVKFEDKTVTYNGQAQALTISGTPTVEGTAKDITVTYEYYNGDSKLDAAPVNVGTYKVIAKFTPAALHKPVDDMEATLTINKATYTPAAFNDASVIYNGQAQTIAVAGELPTGVTVAYEYYKNSVNASNILSAAPVNAGTYKVVAKFTVDTSNYIANVANRTATLTIAKATYDMKGISLENKEVEYNQQAQRLEITGTLPNGVTVTYTYKQNSIAIEGEYPVAVGTYDVIASFAGDEENYNPIDPKTAILAIKSKEVKIPIGVTFGATKNANDEDLVKKIDFVKNTDGSFSAYVADNITYTIEIANNIVPVSVEYYGALNDDGTVKEDSITGGVLSNRGDVVYALVTLDREIDRDYYEDNLVIAIKGERRVVEIRTYEDLLLMASDVERYPLGVRLDAVYKLMNDIDCGGKVWKTIGTRIATGSNEPTQYGESFLGELDGQGFKIYNFKIADESVKQNNINDKAGIALGFFGFISDAYVHNVTFADVTIDFSIARLADSEKYGDDAYKYAGAKPMYFGIVAGRVNIDDVHRIGTKFSDIHVENVNTTNLIVTRAYIGTFFGWDSGIVPEQYGTGVVPIRENLVAQNINIVTKQALGIMNNATNDIYLGGYVGAMFTYQPLVYKNCSVTGITLICERDLTGVANPDTKSFCGLVSGFVAWHRNLEWPNNMLEAYGNNTDGFVNCTLKNYILVDKSCYPGDAGYPTGYDDIYCKYETSKSNVTFTNCTVENDTDKEYGLFRYLFDSNTQKLAKFVYTGTPEWTHVCQSICPDCGKCMDENCQESVCEAKCQKHGDDHVCLHVCPICNKCDDADCAEANCSEKCAGHTQDELPAYDMNGVTFADSSVTFDGNAHTLAISGTLPDGVTVAYEIKQGDNAVDEAINAGEYTVIAKFTGDKWHKNIADMTATLTINKASFNYSDSFNDKTVTYNGQEQSLTISDLPSGVDVTYVYYNGEVNEANKLSGKPTNAGVYTVVAVFTLDNPNYTAVADNATLTIQKASIEVTLGATKNASNADLGGTVKFYSTDNDLWNAYCAADGTFASYTVEMLTSSVNVNVAYYTSLSNGAVVETSKVNVGTLSATQTTIYIVVTPVNDADNYLHPILTVNRIVPTASSKATVEMRDYADLLRMANDAEVLPKAVRENMIYKLMNDIDCGGNVWKTIGPISVGNSPEKGVKSFASELDGQDFTITNFKITNDSVNAEDVPYLDNSNPVKHYALALGFFGHITTASVHNVAFDSITVDIDARGLGTASHKYSWSGNTFIDFGVVAGYVDMGWSNIFHDITVSNLNATMGIASGRVGTFFGVDSGNDPNAFKNGTTTERENLIASNININVFKTMILMQADGGEDIIIGGIVGKLQAHAPVYYKNCSITNVVLEQGINADEWGEDNLTLRFGFKYTGALGGFVGLHDVNAWSEWTTGTNAMTSEQLHDKFENCTITNGKLINGSNVETKGLYTDWYCGREKSPADSANYRKEVQFVECSVPTAPSGRSNSGIFHDIKVLLSASWGGCRIQRYQYVIVDDEPQWIEHSFWGPSTTTLITTPGGIPGVALGGNWYVGKIPS